MHSNCSTCESSVTEHDSTHAKRSTDSTEGDDRSEPSKKARYYGDDTGFELPGLVDPGTQGISAYETNDVLCGRGGGTNQHYGNVVFRHLVDTYREQYLRSKKNDKPFISRSIVKSIRDRNGRFLKKDEASGLYFEIGDNEAREKASQALRQRAPERKRELEEKDKMLSTTVSFHSQKTISESTTFEMNRSSKTSNSSNDLTKNLFESVLWLEIAALRREQAQLQHEIFLAKQGKSSGKYQFLFHASSA